MSRRICPTCGRGTFSKRGTKTPLCSVCKVKRAAAILKEIKFGVKWEEDYQTKLHSSDMTYFDDYADQLV